MNIPSFYWIFAGALAAYIIGFLIAKKGMDDARIPHMVGGMAVKVLAIALMVYTATHSW